MSDEECLVGSVMDDSWLTLDQAARACAVEAEWLLRRLEEGLLPNVESVAGVWRFRAAALVRVRRMCAIERDFDAVPELAALVADMLEELDALRGRIGRARLE